MKRSHCSVAALRKGPGCEDFTFHLMENILQYLSVEPLINVFRITTKTTYSSLQDLGFVLEIPFQ